MKSSQAEYDAVVVGAGPNGLSAAITLAREGMRVLVMEQDGVPGGGVRTDEGPLPGFYHDVCSAIYAMAICSPFFQGLDLGKHGLEWIDPEIPLAHPFDDGTAVAMYQSIDQTAEQFDSADAKKYRNWMKPLLRNSDAIFKDLLAPPGLPSNPLATFQFGSSALSSNSRFAGTPASALFAGNAAHSVLPLDDFLAPGAIAQMLMLAGHRSGWPVARGGAVAITNALCQYLLGFGGEIQCKQKVHSLDELPAARSYLFDTGPHALAEIAGQRLPPRYRKQLKRYRYGPGIFKIDYALSEPVPWKSELCRKAGTVHLGGSKEEIARAELAATQGKHPEKPFVLTAQQSLFDPSRAPEGNHTFWAYCHVPSGSTFDMTEAIENQVERFAPGFRDSILAKQTRNCPDYEQYNPNFVGGDIVGGVTDWRQLLTRPVIRWKPHTTPSDDIFLCSASTPPGGGVHGMCGYWAGREALARLKS